LVLSWCTSHPPGASVWSWARPGSSALAPCELGDGAAEKPLALNDTGLSSWECLVLFPWNAALSCTHLLHLVHVLQEFAVHVASTALCMQKCTCEESCTPLPQQSVGALE
jgi:hypothetical protein